MTDKIKQARDALLQWYSEETADYSSHMQEVMNEYGQTIIEALTALENLDGVDLGELDDALKQPLVFDMAIGEENIFVNNVILCAAQTLANIKRGL